MPYKAVISITIPQIRLDNQTGISMPQICLIISEKADPQILFCSPYQPKSEIVNTMLTTYCVPFFPNAGTAVIQVGRPKSGSDYSPWQTQQYGEYIA